MHSPILKGGEFLIKPTSCQSVFSPEDFTEEQRMMRDAVKEFVEREIEPHKQRFEDHDYDFTLSLLKKAGQLGLLSVELPKKYGGLAMDFVSALLVCDYISGAAASFGTAYGAHTGIGTLPIALYGSEAQKENYLPKLASGEWIGAYALTEPDAGSDANSGKTKAEHTDDGRHVIINGQKMWISNSGFANTFIVFARMGDDKNLSAFIVEYDKSAPNGISLGEEEQKLGIHGSSTRQVFFNNTKIPTSNQLAQRGDGFKIAMHILNIGRIVLAAACQDAQRHIITNAVTYANERQQFGQPISQFEAIKGKLAEMATAAYVGESSTYRLGHLIDRQTNALIDQGLTPEKARLQAVREYAVECSLLKVSCSEDVQRCSDEGIQIYGGMGFSKDTPMEAAWRDARIPRIYEGTNEINRLHAVAMLLKKAFKGELPLAAAAKDVQRELTAVPDYSKPDFSACLAEEKFMAEQLKKVVLMTAGSAVKIYGNSLEEHQHVLLNIADLLIQVYRAESVILRVEKLAQEQGENQLNPQLAIAKLNLYLAVEDVHLKAKTAIVSFSSGDSQKMLLMGLKRFTKYHNYPNIAALKNEIATALITKKYLP